MKQKQLQRMVWMAMLVAIGFVLSPILRVPGMAPMQHFINVIAACTLGPSGAFLVALLINVLRMLLMSINGLAITGSIFGALLAGLFWVRGKKPIWAAVGEWIGTGLIGSMLSFPLMKFVYGVGEIALFTYTPGFIAGTTIGGTLGLLFVIALRRYRPFAQMMEDSLHR